MMHISAFCIVVMVIQGVLDSTLCRRATDLFPLHLISSLANLQL